MEIERHEVIRFKGTHKTGIWDQLLVLSASVLLTTEVPDKMKPLCHNSKGRKLTRIIEFQGVKTDVQTSFNLTLLPKIVLSNSLQAATDMGRKDNAVESV